ncbi:MAG TPA: hypothetical protein DCX07_11820 [Phycisphaerales bacterium]|nr:hypothetical protein [Phycisphaerales bacterium]
MTKRTYTIARAPQPPALTGRVEGTPWALAEVARIDAFPWHSAGSRQATQARILYDESALHVQFLCEDRHVFSRVTDLNGPVCQDSCAELFFQPDPAGGYFNFEVNCCGVFHLGYGKERAGRKLISSALAAEISVAASEPPPTRAERPDDAGWWAAARLPFAVLGEFAGRTVRARAGDVWRGNLYRCGGKTDPQYACWQAIDLPRPDFHCPDRFGEFRLAPAGAIHHQPDGSRT